MHFCQERAVHDRPLSIMLLIPAVGLQELLFTPISITLALCTQMDFTKGRDSMRETTSVLAGAET